MTLRIVDVSKYQVERSNPLSLAAAKQAGFGAVNIALDRGRAQDVLSGWAPEYAAEAKALDMERCCYRWLDNRLPGRDSARRAYDRMVALGSPDGMAHAVDVEDNATEQIVRDYVTEMTRLLGRPIALYTGDWWWTARGWSMADIAPYLWAAPNAGYVGTYPGDDSPHWTAGYGGWPMLSVMQYAVNPLPGTGDCSLSAVRDVAVWAKLTGTERGAMSIQPPRLLEVRQIFQQRTGLSASALGILHYVNSAGKYTGGGGYHAGNDLLRMIGKLDSDYSKRESDRDRPGSNYGSAIDIGRFRVKLSNGRVVTNHDMTRWVLAEIAAGAPDTKWIREIIYSLDDRNVKRYDALGIRTTGDVSHRTHEHFSVFRDDIASPHIPGLFRRFWAAMEGTTVPVVEPAQDEELDMLFFAKNPDGKGPRWGVMTGGYWVEYDAQAEGTSTALQSAKSYSDVGDATYRGLRQPFARADLVLDGTGPVD